MTSEPTLSGLISTLQLDAALQPLPEIQFVPEPQLVRASPAASPAVTTRSVDGSRYPYKNAAYPSKNTDPWGMYMRECVSYTAWRVAASGRTMPYWGGKGTAKLWDDNARAAGIPVDSKPRVHDVAVSNAGDYGHVMYVEAVNADGTITVSQYNARFDGAYSVVTRSPAGLVFIHFP